MENLRISTMTAISTFNSHINLDNLFKAIVIDDLIKFAQHGSYGHKGSHDKLNKKKRKAKKITTFFNQVTLHINYDKIVNVKLFNNGKIQMTGLKYADHANNIINILIPYLKKLDIKSSDKIFDTDEEIQYSDTKTVLINSDFDVGFKVKRDVLHREIINYGMFSSYEPCIYPGVNIKYYYNSSKTGICTCSGICNGKGDGINTCKKVTIAVFNSGKIIITGANSCDQLLTAYKFINNFINYKKDDLICK